MHILSLFQRNLCVNDLYLVPERCCIDYEDENKERHWNSHPVPKQTRIGHFLHSRNHSTHSDHVYSPTNNYKEQRFKYSPYRPSSYYGQPVYSFHSYHTQRDRDSTKQSMKVSSHHQHHQQHQQQHQDQYLQQQQQHHQQQRQHHQHNRRKIRKPSKALFVEAGTDSENEEVDVVMETNKQVKKIVDYEKKIEVLSVLFPDLALNELKDLFENFKEDIQGVVEFLFAKKRASCVEHLQTSSTKPNNTCHRIETLINKS